jgi:predicted DNA-binding transcriptional regulator YafY
MAEEIINMEKVVVIDYTNWKGERRNRRIRPNGITFMATEYHPIAQWLIMAEDIDTRQHRMFALNDVHSWRPMLDDHKAKE